MRRSQLGLIEDMMGALSGSRMANEPALMRAVSGLLGPEGVEIRELLRRLEASGAGDAVHSWLAPGPNMPISPDRLHQALGDTTVQRLAAQSGMTEADMMAKLSQHLPGLVERLCHGQHPEPDLPGNEHGQVPPDGT